MKKHCLTVLGAFLLALLPAVHAQDEVDSAWVMGVVYNLQNGQPMPYCTITLLQGADTVAVVQTDVTGEFMTGRQPAGVYNLQVKREFALYTMDLALYGDANLSIAVDTVKHIDLPTVNVVAPRNMLSSSGLLITSPNDYRLTYTVGGMHREPSNGFKPGRWANAPFYIDPKKTRNRTYVLLNDVFPDVVIPAAAPAQADTAAAKSE